MSVSVLSRSLRIHQIHRCAQTVLQPNTQYLIKVKTSDDRVHARSDKIATISADEERTRDSDMTNFGGEPADMMCPHSESRHMDLLATTDIAISSTLT